MTTQKQMVLSHLKKSSITPLEALRKYGTFRLAALVFNLKAEGHNIVTDIVNIKTKKNPKYVAKYTLKKS